MCWLAATISVASGPEMRVSHIFILAEGFARIAYISIDILFQYVNVFMTVVFTLTTVRRE